MGPPPPLQWRNLSELDQVVTALLASGRAKSAVVLLEEARTAERAPWEMADRIATLRLHLGEPARARAAWENAVEVPQPAVREARIAATYLAENDFESARKHYRLALDAKPDLFEALYRLAVLEADSGDAATAFALAKKAVAAAPDDASRTAARLLATRVARFARGVMELARAAMIHREGELARPSCYSTGAAGAHRLGAGFQPVLVEGLELLKSDAAVVFTRIPSGHERLVPVAKRALRQKLAVELLEDLEARVSRGPGGRLGLFGWSFFRLRVGGLGRRLCFLRLGRCFAFTCRFGRFGWLLFVSRLLAHRAHLLSLEKNQDICQA